MEFKSIGIIGYGAFGAYVKELAQRFVPAVELKVHSSRFAPDETTFFTLESACSCDVVVLCCAISEYEEKLSTLLPLIPKTSVIVDVATVKVHTAKLFKQLAAGHLYICTHPMFGPESDKKTGGNVSGFRIVVTDMTLADGEYQQAKDFLTTCGFAVVEMTAEEHDKLLADTLFITHYIAQTVKTGGFSRTELDTVSFQSLMNAVESVMQDEKLFHDVYRFNPYCKTAALRFHEAQEKVWQALPRSSEEAV